MDENEKLLERARLRLVAVTGSEAERWYWVDVAGQVMHRIDGGRVTGTWTISTAAAGIDARDGSGGTPPGVHRIAARIGEGEAVGAIFVSREPTGEVWDPAGPPDTRDLILTRILTLEGLEEGVNRGPGVDSQERFIYLHGTNHEDLLGEAVSHGCVRLASRDVLEVFANANEGDLLVVV